MIRPVVLLSAICFLSASLGSEESCYLTEEQEDECASVCYPIVKPLLRYFEKCQKKDLQTTQLQNDYSDLKDRYSDLQNKYEKLQSKSLEVDYLKAIIDQKNLQIHLLNEKISDLKEKSELGILTDQFREDIAKLGEIVKNGEISKTQDTINNNQATSKTQNKKLEGHTLNNNITEKVEVKTGEIFTNHLDSTRNQMESKTQTIDRCPQFQNKRKILQEIHIPGLDPFKVACHSNKDIGSGWIVVYQKYFYSSMFNRKYEEYAKGFGDRENLIKNFFIGLEKLHHLMNGRPPKRKMS
nr:fibroleukin-like [Drosophila bipectinata]